MRRYDFSAGLFRGIFLQLFSFRGRMGRIKYGICFLISLAIARGLLAIMGYKVLDNALVNMVWYFCFYWYPPSRMGGMEGVVNDAYKLFLSGDSFIYVYAIAWVIGIVNVWFILAQGAKRCHDMGFVGWWQLIPLSPFVLLLIRGNRSANKYGQPGTQVENRV